MLLARQDELSDALRSLGVLKIMVALNGAHDREDEKQLIYAFR